MMATFKDFIKEKRSLKAMDQATFGKELNVSSATISHWESGWLPSKRHLRYIAQIFNIPIDEIVKMVIKQIQDKKTS